MIGFGLLHEEDQFWIIWSLLNSLEVQGVIHLVFSLDYFFNGEVVMSLLQSVEGNVLVVIVVSFLLPADSFITFSGHCYSLGGDCVI